MQAFTGIVLSAFFAGYAATQVLGGKTTRAVAVLRVHLLGLCSTCTQSLEGNNHWDPIAASNNAV